MLPQDHRQCYCSSSFHKRRRREKRGGAGRLQPQQHSSSSRRTLQFPPCYWATLLLLLLAVVVDRSSRRYSEQLFTSADGAAAVVRTRKKSWRPVSSSSGRVVPLPPMTTFLHFIQCRGGAVDNADKSESNNNANGNLQQQEKQQPDEDEAESKNANKDPQPLSNPEKPSLPRQKRGFRSWLVSSLFDLNGDVKSEASDATLIADESASTSSKSSSSSLSSSSSSSSSASNPRSASVSSGRGGALVKAQPPPKRHRRFQWLSLDTTKVVESLSDNKEQQPPPQDNDHHESDTMTTTTTIQTKMSDENASTSSISSSATEGLGGRGLRNRITQSAVAKSNAWWVNAWADQLPNEEEDVMAAANATAELEAAMDRVSNSTIYNETTGAVTVVKDGGDAKDDSLPKPEESDQQPLAPENIKREHKKKHHKKKKKSHKHKKEHLKGSIDEIAKNVTSRDDSEKNIEAIDLGTDKESPTSATFSLPVNTSRTLTTSEQENATTSYVSSGYWNSIDRMLTLGYASDQHPSWRVSTRLRPVRKAVARATGLHGVLSGKPVPPVAEELDEQQLGMVRRRLAAIERARRNVERASEIAANKTRTRRRKFFWQRADSSERQNAFVDQKNFEERSEAERRHARVRDIDRLMKQAQERLQELACEKDALQRRPNPLWNYTIDEIPVPKRSDGNTTTTTNSSLLVSAHRDFTFPAEDLVEEYLACLFSSGRLVRMNHTDLWRKENSDEDDDEDELSSPVQQRVDDANRRNGNGGSGSWLLRNGLGEKIGEATEFAAYKAVCAAVMSALARALSTLHGLNVMGYSDIRLSSEQAPSLPPIAASMIPGAGANRNYAHDAIQDAMRRGARKRGQSRRRDDFIQRAAVVELLLSQVQIAAPILKMFPIAWQRAMLSNIITMATAVISDFCEGIEFQILGHRLSIAFNPITEEDMIEGIARGSFKNPRRRNPERFEAAVRATAEEVGGNLKFLDRWHERALGGAVLRLQIATLIARLVLTLVDDILSGSRMDLWTAHAGGPRLVAGLEYRPL